MFEKDDKAEFLEAVFPFQEDFSQDNVFGDMKDYKQFRGSQEGVYFIHSLIQKSQHLAINMLKIVKWQ